MLPYFFVLFCFSNRAYKLTGKPLTSTVFFVGEEKRVGRQREEVFVFWGGFVCLCSFFITMNRMYFLS